MRVMMGLLVLGGKYMYVIFNFLFWDENEKVFMVKG